MRWEVLATRYTDTLLFGIRPCQFLHVLAGKQMKNAIPTLCVLAQERSCDHDECGSQDLDKLQQQWQGGMIATRNEEGGSSCKVP